VVTQNGTHLPSSGDGRHARLSVNARIEEKFELSSSAAVPLRLELESHLPVFEFRPGHASTWITTIYFDTRDRSLYERAERSWNHNLKVRVKEYYYSSDKSPSDKSPSDKSPSSGSPTSKSRPALDPCGADPGAADPRSAGPVIPGSEHLDLARTSTAATSAAATSAEAAGPRDGESTRSCDASSEKLVSDASSTGACSEAGSCSDSCSEAAPAASPERFSEPMGQVSAAFETSPLCFVEIKQLRHGTVEKRRFPIPKQRLSALLRGEDCSREIEAIAGPTAAKTYHLLRRFSQRYEVIPVAVVRYRRTVFQEVEDELRITIDDQISVHSVSPGLYDRHPSLTPDVLGAPVRTHPGVVLELKCPRRQYPRWLEEVLRTLENRRFSKFTTSVRLLRESGVEPVEPGSSAGS
jgi:hypothetical protein